MTQPTHAYIGVLPCGCVQMATVDNPEHTKDVRRNVREAMKWGYVNRVLIEEARRILCLVPHPKDICPHPNKCQQKTEEQEEATR